MYAIPFVAIVGGLTLLYRNFTSTGEAGIFAKESIDEITNATVPLSIGLENVANGLQQTEQELRNFSQTEAMLAQARYAEELAQSLANAKDGVFEMALAAREAGQQIDGRLVAAIFKIVDGLDGSTTKAIELNRSLDKISEAKDYVLNTINSTANNLGGHEPSGLLVNSLIEHIAKREITPTIEAIYLLKKESASLG